jgi:Zn-dependent protease/uncharacterized protein YndB with AHSA1/START domain
MISSLISSTGGAVVAPLLALAGWWLCFLAPLGRRKFRASIVIRAPLATVWRHLDPRAPSRDWNPTSESRDWEVIAEAPLTVAFESRRRDSGDDYGRAVMTFPVVEPEKRLVQCVRWRAGQEIPQDRLAFETFDLAESPGGVRTTFSAVMPMRGLIAYETTRASLRRALEALERAALGRPREATARVRFTGWRLLAAGTATAFAVMLGLPVVGSRGWVGIGATLAIPLTLTLAVLLHEFGHALAFVAFGHRGVTISLVPFFGGVTWSRRRYASAFESGVVALAGAAFSAALCLPLLPAIGALKDMVAQLMQIASPAAAAPWAGWLPKSGMLLATMAVFLVAWQATLNAINLLPLPGLDGARALEAIVSDRRLRLVGAACCLAIFALVTGSPRAILEIALFLTIVRLPAILRKTPAVAASPLAPPTPRQRLILIALFALTLLCVGYQGQRVLAFLDQTRSALTAAHGSDPAASDDDDPDAGDAMTRSDPPPDRGR